MLASKGTMRKTRYISKTKIMATGHTEKQILSEGASCLRMVLMHRLSETAGMAVGYLPMVR